MSHAAQVSQHGFEPPLASGASAVNNGAFATNALNPADLGDFSEHNSTNGMFTPGHSAGVATPADGGAAGGLGGVYGSSSMLSDADLDFENILASFGGGGGAAAAPGPDSTVGNPLMGAPNSATGHHAPPSTHLRQSPLPPVNENGQPLQHTTTDFFARPPKPPRRGSAHDFGTPNTAAGTSYGNSPSDTFTTPSTSSKRSVSQERTGRVGRSSSAGGVGKAPRQTSRSRSARRTSSAATAGYQDRSDAKERGRDRSTQRDSFDKPSPASDMSTPAAAAGTPGGNPPQPPPPHNAASMPPPPAPQQPHPFMIPMPGFPYPASYGAHPASLPAHAGGWFPPVSGPMPLPVSMAGPYPGAQSIPPPHAPLAFDPATGWRPTVGSMPASAPPATDSAAKGKVPASSGTGALASGVSVSSTSSKKNKGLEDVQEEALEQDGKGRRGSTEHLTDKRRKRRESHNLVERRRRDNINDRIAELASLLPEAFQAGAPASGSGARDRDGDGLAGGGGPASPAIGSLSLMSPGPSSGMALGGSPTSFPGASTGGGYMAAAAQQRGSAAAAAGLSAQAQAAAQKPNKGAVLAKSVDYIRYLQQVVDLQQQQAAELQRQNAELRRAVEASPSPPSSQSRHLAPQPPCFPPLIPSASVSASTSTSGSRQAGSPAGGGARGLPAALPPSGLGLSLADAAVGGGSDGGPSPRRLHALRTDDAGLFESRSSRGGGRRRASGSRPGRDDDDEEEEGERGEEDRESDEGEGFYYSDGGAMTPECEGGPDGIDCEKGWEAMLQAGGMHVLKMEEDDA